MRVLFLVEAGPKVGLGHLLRCRALLLEIAGRGHQCDLLVIGSEAALAGRAWPSAVTTEVVPGTEPMANILAAVQRSGARVQYDWFVVDGYSFSGAAVFRDLRSHGAKVLVLDDVADRDIDADLVLNQNSRRQGIYERTRVRAKDFLLGPSFALVDPVYLARRNERRSDPRLKRVLVTFGGGDRRNRSADVFRLLATTGLALDVTVAAGPFFPRAEQALSPTDGVNVKVEFNLPDLSESMQTNDLIVTAAGSTVWQACCMGMPMIAIQTADNQSLVVETLETADAALCMDASSAPPNGPGIPGEAFLSLFREAIQPAVRERIAKNAMQLVDGRGAGRVADILQQQVS